MTTATQTPAPNGTTPAPSFEFADAELPKITRTVETAGPNPFSDVLRQSKEQNKGKAVTVPADQVGTVVRHIRRAANDQNIGARIVLQSPDGKLTFTTETIGGRKVGEGKKARTVGGRLAVVKEDGKEYKGGVKVMFKGQNRKARKTKTTPATAPATAPTVPAPTA